MMTVHPKTVEDLNGLAEAGLLFGSFQLPPEVYHPGPGLSNSMLGYLRETPAHLKAYMAGEKKRREVIGTGNHMRTLERDRWESVAVHVPDRKKKENLEKISRYEAEGKFILTDKEYDTVCRMSDAVLGDEEATEILGHKDCQKETSHYALINCAPEGHEPRMVLCRCRTDAFINLPGTFAVGDLKYYNDLSDEELMWQCYRSFYHWQAAFYLMVLGAVLQKESSWFKHIFVRDNPPYLVKCVMLDDNALGKARSDIMPLIDLWENCRITNLWPGYKKGTSIIGLPEKAYY